MALRVRSGDRIIYWWYAQCNFRPQLLHIEVCYLGEICISRLPHVTKETNFFDNSSLFLNLNNAILRNASILDLQTLDHPSLQYIGCAPLFLGDLIYFCLPIKKINHFLFNNLPPSDIQEALLSMIPFSVF